jgi:hypothetical protein
MQQPSSLSPRYARFASQAVLFASLTPRAARNYVRYFATLRSYIESQILAKA